MADQGEMSAGWHPDPEGRHEHRYRDESGWTDQVSDGGVTSTDPPGPGTTTPAAPGPPGAGAPPKKKVPVGILALIGLIVAAAVAGGILLLGGGDDAGGGDAGGGDDSGGDGAEESADGEFSGSLSEDEPFVVRTLDLEAGEAIRARVEPEDEDLDLRLSVGVEEELAATELFGDGEDDVLETFGVNFDDLFSDTLESDLSLDLSESLTEDFSDFQEQLAEDVPALADAGVPIFTYSSGSEGEPEHLILMAPVAGQYSVIVGGLESEGDFDGEIGIVGPSDEFDEQDPDEELDLEAYYEGVEPLREDLCDEEFWDVDLSDLTTNPEPLCDDEEFDELLSGAFSDDVSDDVSVDLSDLPPPLQPVPPAEEIDEYGTNENLDVLADFCFDGDFIACDDLYEVAPIGGLGTYYDYGTTCGARYLETIAGECETLLG